MDATITRHRLLYSLLAIERFGDRMWSIMVGFLVHEYCKNLNLPSNRYLAIFQLIPSIFLTIFLPVLGKKLTKCNRLNSLRWLTILQNTGVVLSAGIFLKVMETDAEQYFDLILTILLIIETITKIVSKAAGSVVLQKDWIVVIAESENPDGSFEKSLTKLNSSTTLIDQIANCVSAIPTLILWDATDIKTICYFVVGYNVVGCFVELFIIKKLANITPKLTKSAGESDDLIKKTEDENNNEKVSGFKIYYRHDLFVLGIVNSLLYFTVLGDNSVTRVYYLSNCVSRTVISLAISLSAISGILGMKFYKFLMKKYADSLKVTKIVSFFHWPVLWLCVISFYSPNSIFRPGKNFADDEMNLEEFCEDKKFTSSVILFMAGIILARFGLWAFDIASGQVFQERVVETERTVIASWQTSFNTLNDILIGICVILVDKNFHFGWHGIASTVVITLAHLWLQIRY